WLPLFSSLASTATVLESAQTPVASQQAGCEWLEGEDIAGFLELPDLVALPGAASWHYQIIAAPASRHGQSRDRAFSDVLVAIAQSLTESQATTDLNRAKPPAKESPHARSAPTRPRARKDLGKAF
ncbi:MAG: hypothetical protein HQL40_13285, partial [Alphaproteobacteria bacterium]|nr:hypothetical protein [Alphaproteobacteria bacterium]